MNIINLRSNQVYDIGFQIISSIFDNDFGAFDLLISAISDVNKPLGSGKSKWTALMFAVHRRRYKFVSKLLNIGANPNCIDHGNKKSVLHIACSKGYNNIVQLLLSSSAILNINYNQTIEGESALYEATKKNRISCIELLLNYKLTKQICDINISTNKLNQTPLLIACDKGDIDIVKLLINYKYMKCNLNKCDHKGYTPLMKAVAKRHINVVQYLLSIGANPNNSVFLNSLPIANINATNNYGQCATMIGIRTNNFKLVKYLLNKNGRNELYRKDWKGRTMLDQCFKFHLNKRIINYVKRLLYINIHSIIYCINTSKDNDIVPYLPTGVVQYICTCTY